MAGPEFASASVSLPSAWHQLRATSLLFVNVTTEFALTEMAYTVVRILQTFERVECRMDEFPMMRTDIVLQPAKGVDIAFLRGEKQ